MPNRPQGGPEGNLARPDLARPDLDPQRMLDAIAAFPDHLDEGWSRGGEAGFSLDGITEVVVCGMGGSAIGADLVGALVASSSPVPWTVVRRYELPASVGPHTLVIGSTYSGGTEETLAAFEQAERHGASRAVVTSGGEAQRLAAVAGLPTVVIPGGLQPRAALGYSLGVLLRVAHDLGLTTIADDVWTSTIHSLRERAAELRQSGSQADALAADLEGRIAVVYTGPGLLRPVGVRWQNQVQENAKQLAYGNVFPELNHNEVMGWEAAPEALTRSLSVVVLKDRGDHEQVRRRMDITRGLLADKAGAWNEVEVDAEAPAARMLQAVQLGDFVSYALAMRAGVDPTPVETIQALKRTLAG